PTDDNDAGVQEADRAGQHLADVPSGGSEQLGGEHRPAAHQGDDVLARVGLDAAGPQLAGDRGAAGDGLEAPDIAAAADGIDVVGHLDVAEVAGGTLRAAPQRTVADDPAADAGRDLDQHQVVDV